MEKYIQRLKQMKIFQKSKKIFQKVLLEKGKSPFWRRVEIGVGIVAVGVILWQLVTPESVVEVQEEKREKTVEVLTFGEWHPDASREVLASLESSSDVDIRAEVAGTIERVLVDIGEEVDKGQVLARFELADDATQVEYENALRTLSTTKMSSENSIFSAEIALQTAERSLVQTRKNEEQKYNQAYEKLRTLARNSETTGRNAIDWADKILGASKKQVAQYNDNSEWERIGSNDRIKRQEIKTKTQEILKEFDILPTLSLSPKEVDYLFYAQKRLELLSMIQEVIRDLDKLIRLTPLIYDFSLADRESYQATAEIHTAALDAVLLSLGTQLETAKSQGEARDLAVLTAENTVETKRAAVELARATAEATIATAQNTVNSKRTSKVDLEVRAPFSGRITAKEVKSYDQVSLNEILFSLVSESAEPKVTAYVTADELSRIRSKGKVEVQLPTGERITVENANLSSKIDPDTQKIQVEIPLETFPKGMMLGSFVKLLVPAQNGEVNLIPISAISFEPDGAEVLIVGKENLAERKKVSYGRILGDGVEILQGLEKGDQVIRYRSRAHAGEKLMINE